MQPFVRTSRLLLLAALLATSLAGGGALRAQDAPAVPRASFATREQLEQLARSADSAARNAPAGALRAQREAEAAQLHQRLDRGDFGAGDRVVVRVEGQAALTDTFTVREGGRLQLPGIPELSLRGVLRSEAEERLRQEIARYIREPDVRVLPLLRIVVTGSVMRPGYYALPADVLVSDAIMAAGGPNADADLSKVELRRGTTTLYAAAVFGEVVREGLTLDRAHLRAGDEILVGDRRRRNWGTVLQGVTAGVGLLTLVLALRN